MSNPIADIIPVTPTQQGLLLLERSESKRLLYHEQYVAKLKGNIDVEKLQKSWQHTVDTFSILRTIFDWDGQNDPVQVVLSSHQAPFAHQKIHNEEELKRYIEKDAKSNFQFDTLPPYRLTLIETSEDTSYFIFTYHHLLLDGSSVADLLQHLATQYNNPTNTITVNNYGAYARWIISQDTESAYSTWQKYASSRKFPAIPYSDVLNDTTHEYGMHVPIEIGAELTTLARTYHLTLNSIFQTIGAAVCAETTQQQVICLGSPTITKPLDGSLNDVVGLCINTLPYAVSFEHKKSLRELAQIHQSEWGALLENGRIGLAEIKKAISYQHYGDPFDVILTYTDSRDRRVPNLKGVSWSVISHNEITHYGLSLDVVVDGASIELKATYRESSYSKASIRALLKRFIDQLTQFVSSPDRPFVITHKLDKTEMASSSTSKSDVATTRTIVDIWSEVFETRVTSETNFFDLGGDSIISLRIVSKLREKGITVSMRDIFDAPSPTALSSKTAFAQTNSHQANDIAPAVTAKAASYYGKALSLVVRASSIQSAILNSPSHKQSLYHDQSTFTYKGNLDIALFEEAWNRAVGHNESLRMHYFKEGEEYFGALVSSQHITLDFVDLTANKSHESTIKHAIEEDLGVPFDLKSQPLLRLRLYRINQNTHVLFISFSLLVTDGWSFAFMLEDVFHAYEQLASTQVVTLEEHLPSYSHYLQTLSPQDIITARQHWKRRLAGVTISKNPQISEFSHLENVSIDLNETETSQIVEFARSQQLSLNSIVQAAWALTISNPEQSEILFGATVSGRLLHNAHYDQTVGLFFNDMPILAKISNVDVASLARSIQNDFQSDLRYSHLSSYEIATLLGRNPTEAPYDSIVVFENYPKMQEDSLRNEVRGGLTNTSHWRRDMADIPKTLYVEVRNAKTSVRLSYNYDVVEAAVASQLIKAFLGYLRSCTA